MNLVMKDIDKRINIVNTLIVEMISYYFTKEYCIGADRAYAIMDIYKECKKPLNKNFKKTYDISYKYRAKINKIINEKNKDYNEVNKALKKIKVTRKEYEFLLKTCIQAQQSIREVYVEPFN